MSALGYKRTFCVHLRHVRFTPKADIAAQIIDVRFLP